MEPLDSLAAAAAPFAALPKWATPADPPPAETATEAAMPFEAWEKVGKVGTAHGRKGDFKDFILGVFFCIE